MVSGVFIVFYLGPTKIDLQKKKKHEEEEEEEETRNS